MSKKKETKNQNETQHNKVTDKEAYLIAKELYHILKDFKNEYPTFEGFAYMKNLAWKLYEYLFDDSKLKQEYKDDFKKYVVPKVDMNIYKNPFKELDYVDSSEDTNQYKNIDNAVDDVNELTDFMFLMK